MQPGIRLHLEELPWHSGERAEALSPSGIADCNGQWTNPCLIKSGQHRHKSLGIFHRIKITKLCKQQNQSLETLIAGLIVSNAFQQGFRCFHDWVDDSADKGSDLNLSMVFFDNER